MISGAASIAPGNARRASVAGVDRRRFEGYASGDVFTPRARVRRTRPPRSPRSPTHSPATFPQFKTQDRRHVVVAVNAMTRAVLAPKAAGAKPRASAFVGRPAALKTRGPVRAHPSPRTAAPARRSIRFVPPQPSRATTTRGHDQHLTRLRAHLPPVGLPSTRPPLNSAPKARAASFTVRAASQTEDLNKKLQEVTATVSEKWDDTEEKPAVVTLGIFG